MESFSNTIVKVPCDCCIHNKVCNAIESLEATEVITKHPYVKVTLECTEFHEKPQIRG